MDWATVSAAMITGIASLMPLIVRFFYGESARRPVRKGFAPPERSAENGGMVRRAAFVIDGARLILGGFVVIALVFGLLCAIYFWPDIKENANLLILAFGLLLVMVAGMFVQVMTSKYQLNVNLWDVTATELIYPVLLSPIVYYPVWGATGGKASVFAFYSAFLNGYFWRSIVAAAQRQKDAEPPPKEDGKPKP